MYMYIMHHMYSTEKRRGGKPANHQLKVTSKHSNFIMALGLAVSNMWVCVNQRVVNFTTPWCLVHVDVCRPSCTMNNTPRVTPFSDPPPVLDRLSTRLMVCKEHTCVERVARIFVAFLCWTFVLCGSHGRAVRSYNFHVKHSCAHQLTYMN